MACSAILPLSLLLSLLLQCITTAPSAAWLNSSGSRADPEYGCSSLMIMMLSIMQFLHFFFQLMCPLHRLHLFLTTVIRSFLFLFTVATYLFIHSTFCWQFAVMITAATIFLFRMHFPVLPLQCCCWCWYLLFTGDAAAGVGVC
jgi:hypothetical protein